MRITSLQGFPGAAAAALLAASLAGCASVGPDYHPPAMKVASSWQAAVPHGGSTRTLLAWWQSFNDPTLDELLASAEQSNPTLAQSAAAIASARATRAQAGAGAFPSVTGSASGTRSGSLRAGGGAAATTGTAEFDASWEVDLFGAVRRNKEAAGARLEAAQADWHSARVSLAAEVASDYVSYRGCRLRAANDRANLASLQKTLDSTNAAVRAGLIAPNEATLAEAAVASASASLNVQEAECDLEVKELVALSGIEEPALRAKLTGAADAIPAPATLNLTSLPVQLLSQRPDLVSAERSLAAASADIGVAEANRYPRLSLLGSISAGHTDSGGTTVSTAPWSFGPSLSLPLFDGGKLRAQVDSARAAYSSALASYESAVRSAVKETEQSLVRLDAANRRSSAVASSAQNYRKYYEVSYRNWQAGSISLLTLEEARRNALQAEQNDITLQRDRVLYGIALYKALGDGWQAGQAGTDTGVTTS